MRRLPFLTHAATAAVRPPPRAWPSLRAWTRGLALTAATLGLGTAPAAQPDAKFGTWGLDLTAQDLAVRAGDDFYRHANGRYLQDLTIPPAWPLWNTYVANLYTAQARERAILEEAASIGAKTDSEQGKLGALYAAFMDQARIEALGARPMARDLAAIRAARSPGQIAALMGAANRGFTPTAISVSIEPDQKAPDTYAVHLGQDGLGLPDPEYYTAPAFAAQRAAYGRYLARLLALVAWTDPPRQADAILAFEIRLAGASASASQARAAATSYSVLTLQDLERQAPGLDWSAFLAAAGLADTRRVIVSDPGALARIAAILATTPVATLQAWQATHSLDAAAPYLSSAFSAAHFDFHGRIIDGTPQQTSRWQRGVDLVDTAMGEAVGKAYVARWFPPASKHRVQDYAEQVRAAFRRRIATLDWMEPATKQEALAKLDRMVIKIGYPDQYRDYRGLVIAPGDLVGDVARARAFEWSRQVARRHGRVDRGEWAMTPQTPNARYDPDHNVIEMPAAFLQPPFFDPTADDAVNYGAIVAQIGHEMSHGFDDHGRRRDAQGRQRDWWTPADASRFNQRAEALVRQYDEYEVLPGAFIKGRFTLGENIADQGGLSLALDAYRFAHAGQADVRKNGLNGEQRFFLAWAQMFRGKMREDAQRRHLVIDPHAPEQFRVNGVVADLDAWYVAFDVTPDQKLYRPPAQRARVW